MMRDKKNKTPEDYAGGGSDFPQKAQDAVSPQKGMIDDDMGKYGGVQSRKTPKTVDKNLETCLRRRKPRKFSREEATLQNH